VLKSVRGLLLGSDDVNVADRGLVVMPCGTGKSLVGLWVEIVHVRFAGATDVLCLVPSLHLVAQQVQTCRDYLALDDGERQWQLLAVCSDPAVAQRPAEAGDKRRRDGGAVAGDAAEEEDDLTVAQLADAGPGVVHVCRTAEDVFTSLRREREGLQPVRLTFATYQSLPLIIEAQSQLLRKLGQNHTFHLCVLDEAHRTAVLGNGATDEDRLFTKALFNTELSIAKRLFLTATPRLRRMPKHNASGAEALSMDNEKFFGRRFFDLGFRKAIEDGMLCKFKIVLVGYELPSQDELQRLRVHDPGVTEADAAKLYAVVRALVDRAAGRLPAKAISFSSKLAEAKQMQTRLQSLAESTGTPLMAEYVSGASPVAERTRVLEELRNCPHTAVVCSAHALRVGVDAPYCDTAIFMSLCSSALDSTQMVGRALRLYTSPDGRVKDHADIIIPVLKGKYEPLLALMVALSSFDAELAALISMLGAAAYANLHDEAVCNTLASSIAVKKATLFACSGVDVLEGVMQHIERRLCDSFDRDVFGALWSHAAANPADTAFLKVDEKSRAGRELTALRRAVWNATQGAPLPQRSVERITLLRAAFPGINIEPQQPPGSKTAGGACGAEDAAEVLKAFEAALEKGTVSSEATNAAIALRAAIDAEAAAAKAAAALEADIKPGEAQLHQLLRQLLAKCGALSKTTDGVLQAVTAAIKNGKVVSDLVIQAKEALETAIAAKKAAAAIELRIKDGEAELRQLLLECQGSSAEAHLPPKSKADASAKASDEAAADAEAPSSAADAKKCNAEGTTAKAAAETSAKTAAAAAEAEPSATPNVENEAADAETDAAQAATEEQLAALQQALSAAAAAAGVVLPPREAPLPRDVGLDTSDASREPWGGRFQRNGTSPAQPTAVSAAAAAALRAGMSDVTSMMKLIRDVMHQKQEFYFMPHTGFPGSSVWADKLLDEDRQRLFPQDDSTPFHVLSFGVAVNPEARLRGEFFRDVKDELGYTFNSADAIIIPWSGGEGIVDGRKVETLLKSLLKDAGLRFVDGENLRKALAEAGVVPFYHPACSVGAAPAGFKEEMMLVSEEVWQQLRNCTCTADLASWLSNLPRLSSDNSSDEAEAAAAAA
jgi:superfamily II DNA or RNA helicase